MKQVLKHIAWSTFLLLIISSCRTELSIYEDEENQTALEANSVVAALMQSVSLNDGSHDYIIDSTSSIEIQMPFTVIVNGIEVQVVSEHDLNTVERILNEFDNDDDVLEILFPIVAIFYDYTEIVIENQNEFENLKNEYSSENVIDEDIECIDFIYPIAVSVFDVVTEQFDDIIIGSDKQMYHFLIGIDDDDIVKLDFIILMVLLDNTEITITSLEELEVEISKAMDTCDEDDDIPDDDDDGDDDGDDDNDDPSMNQFIEILTSGSNWTVDEFVLNNHEIEDNYTGFTFNFTNDDELFVQNEEGTIVSGTWSSYRNGENIIVVFKVTDLEDFNASWSLDEIEQDNEKNELALSRGEDYLKLSSVLAP